MAYDENTRTVTAPIDVGDVAEALGEDSLDVGTLCSSNKINKWEKNKPFIWPTWEFKDAASRDAARKEAHQGLMLPNMVNLGVASTDSNYRYLNTLVRYITLGAISSYPYEKPQGGESQPYRLLDFDGYRHTAVQPFTTGATLIYADGTQELYTGGVVNRFKVDLVRFWVQTANGNVDISLGDFFYENDGYRFYLHTELYENIISNESEFYARNPNECRHSSKSIAEIPIINGFDSIDYKLKSEADNTKWTCIVGFNKYASVNETIPSPEGLGFVAPWTDYNRPFIFEFRQEFYGVLDFTLGKGHSILTAGGSSFGSFDLDYRSTKLKVYSDIVGISINLKKATQNYYVVGQKSYSSYVPDGAVRYMFRLENQQANKYVIGIVSNEQMQETTHQEITAGGSATQTVYLKFPGFLPSGSIENGVLWVSNDDGNTWTTIGDTNVGFSGSSIPLYITR